MCAVRHGEMPGRTGTDTSRVSFHSNAACIEMNSASVA
jgi:hypothetical protein